MDYRGSKPAGILLNFPGLIIRLCPLTVNCQNSIMPACFQASFLMKLLYLTLEPTLDTSKVATGNQVRAKGIREVLEIAGHQVCQLFFKPEAEDAHADSMHEESAIHQSAETQPLSSSYKSAEQLHSFISREEFDSIIVAYWYLLDHVPVSDTPVVLDFIAQRLLEIMFQEPHSVPQQARTIIRHLSKVDHVLAGNQRQADLLLPLLLQAGIDCRQQIPISIVPIATRSLLSPLVTSLPPLKLVNAGVDWPWRNFANYRETLEKLAGQNPGLMFTEYTGIYPGLVTQESGHQQSMLQGYADMQATLQQCHIGLELGERNPEREFSHSYRAMEYLESGLPIIINSWIPLAGLIKQYDAGWVIENPDELEALLGKLLDEPGLLDAKKAGVEKLKAERLNYQHASQPLLDYLSAPSKINRFALDDEPVAEPAIVESAGIDTESEQAIEDFEERSSSNLKIILGSIFKRYFCPRRPDSTPDVLMVTRADLFPVDHGAAVKIIRTAEALSRTGRDVWLMTDSRKEYFQFINGEMKKHHYPFFLRFMCQPRSVAFMKLLKLGFPYSNSFLYMPVTDMSYIVRAIYLTSRKPIGAYQAEFPAYVRPCRFARSLFEGKILLVQHNVEYERIRNQVPDITDKNVQALKNLEIAMCHEADNIIAVSDNDRDRMIADGIDPEKIHTIPHGVDLQAFRTTTPINIRERYRLPWKAPVLVYHGTYSYSPNLESMQVMASEILPRLEQRNIHVTVLAIGSKPPDFPLHPNIIFAGSVDNLAEVIPAADLAVVPLQDGGGTRMKILDYFAAGVPVISTAKGIEGIPVENGREALIIDDFDEIADAIERLLLNPEEANELVEQATLFVDSLGWDAIGRGYLPLLH